MSYTYTVFYMASVAFHANCSTHVCQVTLGPTFLARWSPLSGNLGWIECQTGFQERCNMQTRSNIDISNFLRLRFLWILPPSTHLSSCLCGIQSVSMLFSPVEADGLQLDGSVPTPHFLLLHPSCWKAPCFQREACMICSRLRGKKKTLCLV